MRLLVPDDVRLRGLLCEEATLPQASPVPPPAVGSGRTMVVGIRQDAASKELLTWALVKVANAVDRIVALHVAAADGAGDSLASVLAVYDGFCNLKQGSSSGEQASSTTSSAASDVKAGGGATESTSAGVSTDKNRNFAVLVGTVAALGGLGWYLLSKPKKSEEVVD